MLAKTSPFSANLLCLPLRARGLLPRAVAAKAFFVDSSATLVGRFFLTAAHRKDSSETASLKGSSTDEIADWHA